MLTGRKKVGMRLDTVGSRLPGSYLPQPRGTLSAIEVSEKGTAHRERPGPVHASGQRCRNERNAAQLG